MDTPDKPALTVEAVMADVSARYPRTLAALDDQPSDRAEFCARFRARMIAVAGETFDDGESIGDYADEVGPTYFDETWQRDLGPEACADADMSYWGED